MVSEDNSGVLWICFTSLYDFGLKPQPPSQPIKRKTDINPSLVSNVSRA